MDGPSLNEHLTTSVSAGRVLLPDGKWSGSMTVELQGGRVATLREGPSADGTLTAGLVDIHNNGAYGVDFADASPADLVRALRGLAARGVTGVQPTVTTAPLPDMLAAMDRLHALPPVAGGARVLGVHLEGPFLAPGRRGAHRADWLRDPEPAAIDALLAHAGGLPRTITLAPERPHALDAIGRLAAAGVVVSLGHSDATADEVRLGVDAGARMVTHLFNAMRPLGHRDPALTGIALTDPRLFVGLIVDGLHVDPVVCRLAFQAAAERVIAVSDSVLLAGLEVGAERSFGGMRSTLNANGVARRDDGTIAGAAIVLDEGVRRMVAAGIDPATVLRACTETPAQAIGRPDLGVIAPGARADLVLWDAAWRPCRVWVDGVEVPGVG